MGTIAVTGATGYLAEKLIERLITQGHTIHAIARNEGKLGQRIFLVGKLSFKRIA